MKVELDVCLGNEGIHVGDMVYSKEGHRESCQFKYTDTWMNSPDFFELRGCEKNDLADQR